VVPADELPRRHRKEVHVEESDITAIKLLDRQNTGLADVIVRRSVNRDAKSAHFAALVSNFFLGGQQEL